MNLFHKMRKQDSQMEADRWFQELDSDTQRETTIKYLRSLNKTSLKNLMLAVEKYREGDQILLNKVKDPEPNEDLPRLGEEDIPAAK